MKRIYLIALIIFFIHHIQAQIIDWAAPIGSYYTDRALSVLIDNQGNKYIGGHFSDTVDFDLGAGTAIRTCPASIYGQGQAYVLKLDANDNFAKVLTFGGINVSRYLAVSAMGKDASGNLFLAGFFNGSTDFDPDTSVFMVSPNASNNIFLLKLDANENLMWVKQWAYNYNAGINGGKVEDAPSMVIDAMGNIILAGKYKETVDFDPDTSSFTLTSQGQRGYVLRVDNDGNFMWAKSINPDTAAGDIVLVRSVSADANGNVYVAGDFTGTVDFNPDTTVKNNLSESVQQGFLLKLSANGSFGWVKQMGGVDSQPIQSYNSATAVAVDGASNVLLTGNFMGTITMGSNTLVSNGYSDVFFAKLDASGNYLWANSIGNTWDAERTNRLTVDAANNIYAAGTFQGGIDLNPGAGSRYVTSNGSIDAFIAKLNTNGGFEWGKSFGGTDSYDLIYGVAVKDNSVYVVGRFITQMNCDNDGSYYINAADTSSIWPPGLDGWVAKLNQGATGIAGVTEGSPFAIYPNPATDDFVIDFTGSTKTKAHAVLLDVHGRKIRELFLDTPVTKVDVSSLQKGLYFVQIENNGHRTTSKLVIE